MSRSGVLAVLLALAPASARAAGDDASGREPRGEDRVGGFAESLQLGTHLFGLGVSGKGQNLSAGLLIGVRAGYQVSAPVRLELDFMQILSSVNESNTVARGGAFAGALTTIGQVHYDLVSEGRLVPFLKAGVGFFHFVASDQSALTAPAFLWGGGVAYLATDVVAVRADLAQEVWTDSSPFAEHKAKATANWQLGVSIEVLAGGRR